jgi:hypothetical protein
MLGVTTRENCYRKRLPKTVQNTTLLNNVSLELASAKIPGIIDRTGEKTAAAITPVSLPV